MKTHKIVRAELPDLLESPEITEGERSIAARRLEKSPTAFRTISEVADELSIPQHVLRFWETKFPQIRPMKRGGGRRYYRPEDMVLLRQISQLLYEQGFTIRGVQKLMRERGLKKAGDNWLDGFDIADAAAELQPLLIDDHPETPEHEDNLSRNTSDLQQPTMTERMSAASRRGGHREELKQVWEELVILRDRLKAISR